MAENAKLSYWYCDECKRTLNHGEYRYTCTVCNEFDYCEACMERVDPPHLHRMVKELAYGRAERKKCSPKSMPSIIHTAMEMYADRHCLGVRDGDSYSWLSFKTVGDRAKNFGHGLRQLIEPRAYLAICSLNRPEWMITDFACMFQGIISVPIYRLFSEREIIHVINNTQVSVVVCDGGMLERFVKVAGQCPSLRHIVCMDPISDFVSGNVNMHYMDDIEGAGSVTPYESVITAPGDLITVLYTSGSSEFPKGVQVTELAFRSAFERWCIISSADHIYFSYRPLAWAADRDAVIATFICGGRTGFSTGDVACLMEELAMIRPSDFSCPPSICNQIHREFTTALLLATQEDEQTLLEQFSKLIPTRCKAICLGGALVSPTVVSFMQRCFPHCSIEQSYGITECGSIAYNNIIDASVEYRLESVPELGYTVDDQPYPRGELLAKTTQMFSGYINDPLQTADVLTDDGFFRTGDIVELRPSSTQPQIYVIDRKKNFFKLAQGQFIAPEYLQSLFIQSAFIDQIFIHADLISDTLTAVVVPNRDNTQLLTSSVDEAILADLRSIGEKESLRPHEIPSRLIIDFQPFTPENGLLTSSMKLCRYKLAAHYAQQLKSTASTSVQQRLRQIIESVRGKVVGEQETNLISSGTDSLSTVRLSKLIEKDLGISVPLHILFDPNITLQQLD